LCHEAGRVKLFRMFFEDRERGYRSCRNVSASIPLFHQTVGGYEMWRHRILFCFLFEDRLVTQFPRKLCHEAGRGHLLWMTLSRQRVYTQNVKNNPQCFPFFIRQCMNTTCVEFVSSSVSFPRRPRDTIPAGIVSQNWVGKCLSDMFVQTERGYRKCKSVCATVSFFPSRCWDTKSVEIASCSVSFLQAASWHNPAGIVSRSWPVKFTSDDCSDWYHTSGVIQLKARFVSHRSAKTCTPVFASHQLCDEIDGPVCITRVRWFISRPGFVSHWSAIELTPAFVSQRWCDAIEGRICITRVPWYNWGPDSYHTRLWNNKCPHLSHTSGVMQTKAGFVSHHWCDSIEGEIFESRPSRAHVRCFLDCLFPAVLE